MDGATSEFGPVVRNGNRSLVVSPSFTFRTDVQPVQMPAKQARGRVWSSANQMSPSSALLDSLKELHGTTQRFSVRAIEPRACYRRFGCSLFPPSGSILSSSLKSMGLPLASRFAARVLVDAARFLVACMSAELGRGHALSRDGELASVGSVAHVRCRIIGKYAQHRSHIADVSVHDAE